MPSRIIGTARIEPLEKRQLLATTILPSSGQSSISAIAADERNNIYAVGTFSGVTTFGPTKRSRLTARGANDLFVMRVAASDSSVLVRQISSDNGSVHPSRLIVNRGRVFICGDFASRVDFDPGAGVASAESQGLTDGFLLALDSSALSFKWVRTFGGTDNDLFSALAVDSHGDLWGGGSFRGQLHFGPSAGRDGPEISFQSHGSSDAYLAKWSGAGTLLYAGQIGGTGSDAINSMAVDRLDNVIAGGLFQNSIDSTPGAGRKTLVSGVVSGMLVSLGSSGQFRFSSAFLGSQYASVSGVSIDSQNNIILSGTFLKSMDVNPGSKVTTLTSAGKTDVWVAKLSPAGVLAWGFSLGGAEDDSASSMMLGSKDELFVTGSFRGQMDVMPGKGTKIIRSDGEADAYVLRFSSSGGLIGGSRIGGTGNAIATGLMRTKTKFYLATAFSNAIDLAAIPLNSKSHTPQLYDRKKTGQAALIEIDPALLAR
jgi:hypothetical protein